MNNEIKEILNKLEIVARKHTIEVCEDGSKIETMPASVVDELRLNNYSSKLLLDYITNLEEKIRIYEAPEDLTLFYMWLDTKAKDKMKQLQQEIKESEEAVKYWQNQCNLRERAIDKVIEYIKSNEWGKDYELSYCRTHLLNILKGEDNE